MALPELAVTLSTHLSSGSLECSVCTEGILRTQPLWYCRRCFGIQHLACIVYWAQNDAQSHKGLRSDEFRCPLCQSANTMSTLVYRCFCGQLENPSDDMSLTPGCCGQTCSKRRPDPECPHKCIAQCHPGPCPPCGAVRQQACFCGSDEKTVGCSSCESRYSCGAECGKELSCGRHYCEKTCHGGQCAPCPQVMIMKCFCGKHTKEAPCGPVNSYSCGGECDKVLDCGNHRCMSTCHDGHCVPCLRVPERQLRCACGKASVSELAGTVQPRSSCLDPIPTCGQPCGLPLPCGLHTCRVPCHDGPCPPCLVMTEFPCRCQRGRFMHPCFVSYVTLPLRRKSHGGDDEDDWDEDNPDDFDRTPWLDICTTNGINKKTLPTLFPPRCPRRCAAKKACGKHSCTRLCCGDGEHLCTNICHKKAPCGIHECGRLCHQGPCPPCDNYSYDPLFCRCRRTVVDPPVPCNTPPPRCNHPCIVPRPCGHGVNHTCHQGDCPPCMQPVARTCGSHGEKWPYFLACSAPDPSCGRDCEKVCPGCLSCCRRKCHGGPCVHQCSNTFTSIGALGPRR